MGGPDNWLRRWARPPNGRRVPSRQLKQIFTWGSPGRVCHWCGLPGPSFRPAPPNPDDRVLMRCCRAVTEPAKDQAVEERRLEAIEARRRRAALPSAPGPPDGAATLVEAGPRSVRAPEIGVALCCGQVGQPQSHGHRSLGRCAAVTETFLLPRETARHRLALAALPAGANGLWLSTTAGSALLVNGQALRGPDSLCSARAMAWTSGEPSFLWSAI